MQVPTLCSCRTRYLNLFRIVGSRRAILGAIALIVATISVIVGANGQPSALLSFIPNGFLFLNPNGASQTYSTINGGIDQTGPFFQSLGTNGRSCSSCHQPSDGMSVSALGVELRFFQTQGLDPIFRPVDGSNCNTLDVSTVEARYKAYSLLRTRGLIRIALAVPATANYSVQSVENPYGCGDTQTISMYRRPLPATNLRFISSVMFDGRESTPLTQTTKLSYANDFTALVSDLAHQSVDATTGHAQGDGSRPTASEQQQIVNFEMALSTAQAFSFRSGFLNADGANGGPLALVNQPFFISINSSVDPLVPNFEPPGGLVSPGDGQFTPAIFNAFEAWATMPQYDPRASVARGETLFNSLPINITGVAGINDDVLAGGLVPGGIATLTGTCGTCHDTPNVGNHSFPTPLDIGTGDPDPSNPSTNLGGLDISYLPSITVCKTGMTTCKTTTDLGQALIDGNFNHVGKIKGPILRGLSARAPYFHNGSAQSLLDVVRFYEKRFGLALTLQQESDLVAFLSSL